MKLRLTALAIATLLASTASFAGVVTSSSNIDFLAVDGQKTSTSLLKESHSLNLNGADKHQVVVRVSEIVRDGSDRELFESDPIVVTFQGTNEDIKITAPHLSNQRDVEKFKAQPKIDVITASGKSVSNQQEYLKQEGFLPGVNLVENLSAYNSSGAAAAVPAFATTAMPAAMGVAPTAGGKASKAKVTVQGENVAEQMLQYWFQQADPATKARFLNWAKKN